MAWTTFVDGTTAVAGEVNANFTIINNSKYTKFITDDREVDQGLIIFSNGTHWSTTNGISTDSGATWSAGGFGNTNLASVSGANGITLGGAGKEYTTDSGVTWTAASTDPPNWTATHSVHLFSSTIGVSCGDSSSGASAWYTADGGDNWAQSATGPTADTNAVQMASATIGYMVDVSSNIWKTTNAGADWTDTTDNLTSSTYPRGCGIVCIDTDTIIILISNDTGTSHVYHYTNSTNTIRKLYRIQVGESLTWSGNSIVVADNGNIYWMLNARSLDGYWLFMWDGTYLYQRYVVMGEDVPKIEPYVATYGDYIYANVAIYEEGDPQIIAIDVRGD